MTVTYVTDSEIIPLIRKENLQGNNKDKLPNFKKKGEEF